MRSWLVIAVLLAGCAGPDLSTPQAVDENLFAASAMRIHPIFTQVKDWTGDGRPDGIEVLLEFQDRFGDPTKAAGTVLFELYEYRQGVPDGRGPRVANPWRGPLETYDDQRARWNRTSRTYSFQLAWGQIQAARSYVLTATFKPVGAGPRLVGRLVLAGAPESPEPPATRPAVP
jgi:hypothetical protein